MEAARARGERGVLEKALGAPTSLASDEQAGSAFSAPCDVDQQELERQSGSSSLVGSMPQSRLGGGGGASPTKSQRRSAIASERSRRPLSSTSAASRQAGLGPARKR